MTRETCKRCNGTGEGVMLECSGCDGVGSVPGLCDGTNVCLPPLQLKTLQLLLDLAIAVNIAVEASEELSGASMEMPAEHADALNRLLEELDELPDDKPDYTLSRTCKAAWALRDLIGGVS